MSLLRKALFFPPDHKLINEYQFHLDQHHFSCNLHLGEYFHQNLPPNQYHSFKLQKNGRLLWIEIPNLEFYIKAVEKDILKQVEFSPPTNHNLTPFEKKCLEELQNRTDNVIKPADKGGAVVIMDKFWYRNGTSLAVLASIPCPVQTPRKSIPSTLHAYSNAFIKIRR